MTTLDFNNARLLVSGQTTDLTPAGRTSKDDGGEQRGEPRRYVALTTGQYAGTTNITVNAKTDVHSNECVQDAVSGLMYSRTLSDNVFGAGTEGLLWDGTAASDEDIFEYCDQANLASLSSYTDWRVISQWEAMALMLISGSDGYPDSTYFPGWNVTNIWCSTTAKPVGVPANAIRINYVNALTAAAAKTTNRYPVALVRGGPA